MKNIRYKLNDRRGFWQSQMMMGVLTAGFGVAILVFPNLLQMLVAGLFLMIGLFLMLSALTVKRLQDQMGKPRKDIFDV